MRRGSRWRVRLESFAGAASTVGPHALRGILTPSAEELKTFGADADVAAVPDDLLVAAASCGALTCLPFLDILDGGCFARATCLCCYAAHSAAKAREAAASLQMFQKYYDAGSYLKSRAFVRTVACLSRDLRPEEAAEVKEHVASLDETPDSVRELNAVEGLCVAVPACQSGVLWIYSTPAGRRLLRHLSRGLRKGGAPLRVTVASSDPTLFPRFRYRMYAASLLYGRAGGGRVEDLGLLLDAALAWARSGKARGWEPGKGDT